MNSPFQEQQRMQRKLLYGAGSKSEIKHSYELNDNGDKVVEIIYKVLEFEGGSLTESTDTLNFDYIYDYANNWIVKIQKQKDKIILITQRTIEYK
jgi:hypothetical protein